MARRWPVVATAVLSVTLVSCSPASKRVSKPSPAPAASTTVPTTATSTGAAAGATPTTGAPAPRPATASGTWTTYFHDAGRSGATRDGPAAPGAVRRQWTSPALDGEVYAQPLVVGEVVIEATENDTVYALDATTGSIRWRAHVGSPVASSTLPCGDVSPVVGITSTPVVDPSGGRVFAVGLVEPGHDVLFELNLATGAEVASTGVDPPGANPATANQRGALTLDGTDVLVPFGGRYGDCGTYHGLLTSVPAAPSGLGTATFYTLPTTNEGGFWAPPGPVVAADGSVFLTSGNSASASVFDDGDSVIHLSAGLTPLDSFAPSDWASLNASDGDLGSTNPVLVGGQVFQVGKAGIGYLLTAGHLGGIGGQVASAAVCRGEAMGGVSRSGTTVFVPCPDDLAAVSVANGAIAVAWTASLSLPGPAIVTPGAVWMVATGSGQLVALNPATGRALWSQAIGSVPSRFTSPAAGSGRIVVAVGTKLEAFGD